MHASGGWVGTKLLKTNKMGSDPLVWFCRPVAYGVWSQETDTTFGAYTPCAIGSIVGNVSHLVLAGLCLYRIWLIKINTRVKRFSLRSKIFNYILALLASCCAAEPLFRLVMGVSIFNLDAETGLHPFEVYNFFTSLCRFMNLLSTCKSTFIYY